MTTPDIKQFRSEYDEKSLGMLSDILSTLYANPERSVLREYIANAIDAHQAAGTKRPVEVKLPTQNSTTLVIRDYGGGLSEEALQNTFFKYVASTKTNDDTQIGALGIGAKSAFALTKSWTVTNIHKGKKAIIASVNDSYGAPMQTVVVDDEPTKEPSGIEVSIPISREHLSHPWASTLDSLMLWFPKGSVRNITAEHSHRTVPSHWTDSLDRYGDVVFDAVSGNRAYANELQVLMCGIVYTVDSQTASTVKAKCADKLIDMAKNAESAAALTDAVKFAKNAPTPTDEKNIHARQRGVINTLQAFLGNTMKNTVIVDTGAIDFMPSRESVKGTPRTIEALVEVITKSAQRVADDIVALRTKEPIDRVPGVRTLVTVGKSDLADTLNAVEIHDENTRIMRTNSSVGLHALLRAAINLNSLPDRVSVRALVTHVPSDTPLYKCKKMERHTNTPLYCTAGDSFVTGFGDVSSLFGGGNGVPGVMSLAEYKAVVARMLPRSGGAGAAVKHDWWTVDNGYYDAFANTFDDIMDALDDTELPVYVVENPIASGDLTVAADNGFRGHIIVRGRRLIETFAKELGTEVHNGDRLNIDIARARVRKHVERVMTLSDAEVYDILVHNLMSGGYIRQLMEVIASPSGSLLMPDHRARALVASYKRGEAFKGVSAASVLALREKAQDGDYKDILSTMGDRLSKVTQDIDDEPWALITANTHYDSRALRQAAVYLAAIG